MVTHDRNAQKQTNKQTLTGMKGKEVTRDVTVGNR